MYGWYKSYLTNVFQHSTPKVRIMKFFLALLVIIVAVSVVGAKKVIIWLSKIIYDITKIYFLCQSKVLIGFDMTLILKFLPPPPLRLNKNFQHIILGKEQRRKKSLTKGNWNQNGDLCFGFCYSKPKILIFNFCFGQAEIPYPLEI